MRQELLSKHLLDSVLFNTIHSLFTCLLPSCLPVYLSYESGTALKTFTGFHSLQPNSFTLHLPAAFLSACLPVLWDRNCFKNVYWVPFSSTQFIHSSPACCLPVCLSTCLMSQELLSKISTGFCPLQHTSFTLHLPAAFLSACLPALWVRNCFQNIYWVLSPSTHFIQSSPACCLPVYLSTCLMSQKLLSSSGFSPLQHLPTFLLSF
jgi:hypothetical protein